MIRILKPRREPKVLRLNAFDGNILRSIYEVPCNRTLKQKNMITNCRMNPSVEPLVFGEDYHKAQSREQTT